MPLIVDTIATSAICLVTTAITLQRVPVNDGQSVDLSEKQHTSRRYDTTSP